MGPLRYSFLAMFVALLADLAVTLATIRPLAMNSGDVLETAIIVVVYAALIWFAAYRRRAESRAANLTAILLLLPYVAGCFTSGIIVGLHKAGWIHIPLKWRTGSDSWASICLAVSHVAVGTVYIVLVAVNIWTRSKKSMQDTGGTAIR